MGAWGAGSFENDDASDWVNELVGAGDFAEWDRVLDVTGAEYLEAPDGSVALAAAEVVAAALGQPSASLPAEVAAWVDAHRTTIGPDDAGRALSAVDRVLGENSELRELWDDGGEDGWEQRVNDLRSRLTAARG